jgi:hypothetical protein
MNLKELFESVKEHNLTKTQLENYHSELTSLYAQMLLEMAELEKTEAIFFLTKTSPEVTDVSIKRMWRGTQSGLRLIELKSFVKATEKVLSSLKNRIYSNMY